MNDYHYKPNKLFGTLDTNLVIGLIILCIFSLINLYSAGYVLSDNDTKSIFTTLSQSRPALKQASYFGIGFVLISLLIFIPATFLQSISYIAYSLGLILLVLVAKFGIVVKGSRRWLDIGPVNLQPAELIKMGVILALSSYLSSHPPQSEKGFNLKELIVPALIVGLPAGLIMLQPDLGTAMTVLGIGTLMILFIGIQPRIIVTSIMLGILLSVPAWNLLHDYQKKRILILVNPESDPLGSGYHITQSKIAVGSGQIFGKGFLRGTQSQLEFLPEHHTDFVFSVLAEEWGFAGCAALLLLYLYILGRILRIAIKSKDLFSMFLVIGFGSMIFVHAIINLGMVIGLFPVVGIPLPLMSYGGSSVLSTMTGLGIILGISTRRGL